MEARKVHVKGGKIFFIPAKVGSEQKVYNNHAYSGFELRIIRKIYWRNTSQLRSSHYWHYFLDEKNDTSETGDNTKSHKSETTKFQTLVCLPLKPTIFGISVFYPTLT